MKRFLFTAAAALGVSAAACTTDSPTDVGSSLLSSGDIITFEVRLPAAQFLAYDTSFAGFANAVNANFGIIAQKFEGVVDAHVLARFALPPRTITVRTTGTTTAIDSTPHFFSGRLTLKFDTTAQPRTLPARLHLFHTAESWDVSATWTNRVDTLNAHVPWTTPGGTRGASIDTATWVAGDSVVFNVDSASLALWADSANAKRGALVVSETNGTRLRILAAAVHVSTHSTLRADTVVAVDLVPVFRTFVFNPTPASPASGIRVGGTPAWRSILRLRPDLIGNKYPCGNGIAGCTVTLDSVHLSSAQLLLKPKRPPLGFAPEDTLVVEARTLAPATAVPLERSPLGNHLAYSRVLPPTLFTAPPDSVTRIDITQFMAHLTNTNSSADSKLPPYLALLQLPEPATFGFAEFEPNPVLRLVLTSNVERRP